MFDQDSSERRLLAFDFTPRVSAEKCDIKSHQTELNDDSIGLSAKEDFARIVGVCPMGFQHVDIGFAVVVGLDGDRHVRVMRQQRAVGFGQHLLLQFGESTQVTETFVEQFHQGRQFRGCAIGMGGDRVRRLTGIWIHERSALSLESVVAWLFSVSLSIVTGE